jgi:hypothetical protein
MCACKRSSSSIRLWRGIYDESLGYESAGSEIDDSEIVGSEIDGSEIASCEQH